jgi:hypothetical protein
VSETRTTPESLTEPLPQRRWSEEYSAELRRDRRFELSLFPQGLVILLVIALIFLSRLLAGWG